MNRKRIRKTPAHKKVKGKCIVPGAMPIEALGQFIVNEAATEEEAIQGYVEWQARDEVVKHLEKVASENIFGQPMNVWDVRTNKNRWWVITNPTNLYSQRLFPSLDYTLSFHVGVTTRMAQSDMCEEQVEMHDHINQLWNKMARARAALFNAQKSEDFQAVGMKCRECLISLVQTLAEPSMVPKGEEVPQKANFIGWCDVIANNFASGASNERMRSYLKDISKSAWQLVSWLTHAQKANKFDGAIACDATENVLQGFTLAAARHVRT